MVGRLDEFSTSDQMLDQYLVCAVCLYVVVVVVLYCYRRYGSSYVGCSIWTEVGVLRGITHDIWLLFSWTFINILHSTDGFEQRTHSVMDS